MPAVPAVSRLSPRQRLVNLMAEGAVLNEVYVQDVDPGVLDLLGVTVESVGSKFVVFNQAGSGGVGRIAVAIDKIVALDIAG